MKRAILSSSLLVSSLLVTAMAGAQARAHHRHHHRARPIAPVAVEETAPPGVRAPADVAPPAAPADVPPSRAPVAATADTAPDTPVEITVVRAAPPRPRYSVLEVAVGAGVVTRQLSFNDDLFSRLHGYRLPAAPAVDAALTWFPAARWTRGLAAHLGVALHGRFVTVTQSRASDGASYPTSAYDAGADLVGRIPLGKLQPELAVGYGRQAFEIKSGAQPKPSIPGVTQDFVRFALGLRARLGRVELAAHGAYRLVLGGGELTDAAYFPRARLDAIDVDATVAVALGRGVSLRGDFTLERMFASLRPRPGDPLVAGGAVDQSIGGALGLAYRF